MTEEEKGFKEKQSREDNSRAPKMEKVSPAIQHAAQETSITNYYTSSGTEKKDRPQKKKRKESSSQSSWTESIDWEEWVGQKLLQKLGIVIVLVGMAVFLKYSFDNGWIGPHGRIAMSTLVSCALLFAGEWFQKKYPTWFQAFTGGGLALLYFTVWAAHVFYAGKLAVEITPLMATILYGGITVIGALAAIRYKAQTVAWFAVAGGYITPMLIEGVSDPMGFVLYLAILAAGLLILAWHQKWRYLNVAAFVLTQLYVWGQIYALPVELFSDTQQLVVANGFFVLFGLLPFIYQFRLGTPTEIDDILLTVGNGLAVFLPVVDAVGGIDSQYTSLVCVALAAVYLGYAAMALHKITKDNLLINTYLISAVVLVALAILAELKMEWVAAGWAPFSALLVYISVRLQRTGPWQCAVALLAGSIFFLAIQTPGIQPMDEVLWQPFTSAWSLQSYIVFASLLLWLIKSKELPQQLVSSGIKHELSTWLHVLTALLLFGFISFNTLAFGVPGIDWTIDIMLTLGHVLFAAIAIIVFILTGAVVWFVAACLTQVFILMSVFLLAESSGMLAYGTTQAIVPLLHPWAGVSLAALLLAGGTAYVATRYSGNHINKAQTYGMIISVMLAQVWVHVSVEVYHLASAFDWSHMIFMRALGGWWILFAVALQQWGIHRNQMTMAKAGIFLLIPALLKDFGLLFEGTTTLYEVIQWTVIPLVLAAQAAKQKDTFALQWLALFFGAFAAADMLYSGYQDFYHVIWWTLASFVTLGIGTRLKGQPLVLCGAIVLGVVAGIDMITHLSSSAQGVLRTVWWAIAALATIGIGFSEKEQLVRKVGICLFFATTIKLLIFDFAVLSTGIRIAASIITGLMMIGASYLYQRFGTSFESTKKRSISLSK